MRLRALLATLFIASLSLTTGCTNDLDADHELAEDIDRTASALTRAERRTRAAAIRDASAAVGLRGGFLLAGIADAETQMSHCWSELTWACRGPNSVDCGGGPTVAGAGDGPCSLRQGGIGMFQFDAGTFDDTLRREGNRILTVAGNTQAAVDFVVRMVIDSVYISGVSNRAEAIAWMNGVRVDNDRFRPWIQTVTHYYNGCLPSYSCYAQRYAHYRDNAVGVWNEMGGASFWLEGSSTPPSPSYAAIEVYWTRGADGVYQLRALAPASVSRVVYRVDGYVIGRASRADGDNFPTQYRFAGASTGRLFEVLGLNDAETQIAYGNGRIDTVASTGVFVKQLGAGLYEIGLERPPAGVTAIEVRADGSLLTDETSGASRSARLAVRSRFTMLGLRRFEIRTLGADGAVRGTLRRELELR
jgi:hypothetical protein